MSRLILALLYLALSCAKTSAQAPFAQPETQPASIQMALAGLPQDSVTVGHTLYFTVQEDVLCDGHLYIPAGARANGLVMMIERHTCGLYLVLFPQGVQTVSGQIQALDMDIVRLQVDEQNPYTPFVALLPAHIQPDVPLYSGAK